MQPTVSPWAWVSSWDRRARTRAAGEYARSHDRVAGEYARSHDRAAGEFTRSHDRAAGEFTRSHDRAAPRSREHDKYAFYGLRKDSRHFIRLDPLAKGLLLNRQWPPTSAPVTWRVDRFHDMEPWAVPDIKSIRSYRPYEPVSIVLNGGPGGGASGASGASGTSGTSGASVWSQGARGWAAGAVLLALLVLLVRAAENCLHKRLFKAIYMHTIRQESDEWSTPNVTATSLQHHDFDVDSQPHPDDVDALTEPGPINDMPPPYSECASSSITNLNKYISEEPPPPYSACYVAYTNPKDGEPQVHIRRQNVLDERAHSSTDIDNVQNDLIENGLRTETNNSTDSEDVDPGTRMELVFDNGRIVERLSLDLNSNSNETEVDSNDDVEEHSTRHADFINRVVYIDETASESTTPDRTVLV